ncbi:hypothetical protein EMN47_16375 [Prolixibacteraceae bacterium JC049]|nr:hypothetical protein [Prolixibacteraceae bacterium JC049]
MVQTVVIILFLLAFATSCLQFSLFPNRKVLGMQLVLIAVFMYFIHSWAIEQSYSRIKDSLSDMALMTDYTVLQVIEAIGGVLLSIFLIRMLFKEPVKKVFRYFVYCPGIMLFPALFYFESYLFLTISGVNFQLMAVTIAIVVPFLILIVRKGLLKLIPEAELRLELKFGLHLIQLAGAVILSILLFSLPVPLINETVEITQLLLLAGSVIIVAVVGFVFYNYRLKKILN